ncbi:MAG: capsule assembly Wzi family protein, partial [Muribaculaceae bacterium]|nr:capsule assembly Wzi family protein [Muribaculaceae bacterium]
MLDSLRYHAGITLTGSSGSDTPFWLVSNRQGLSNVRSDFGYVRLGLDKPMAYDKRWSWGAGADIALGWRMQSVLTVQQLYVESRYRCLGAYLGSKELPDIFGAKGLSSGNLLYSGNARPIPQLRIGIFDYAPIWGLKGWLSAKGYLSFGMFTDSKWQKSWYAPDAKRTEDVLYHSKGLWLRNGNPDVFPLTLECGIEMATQFGGISYHDGEVIHMPHSLKDWLKALVPMGGDATTPTQEQTNVQGNMTGCWDFRLAWAPSKSDWSVSAYYEHYFEDHSQLYIEYAWKDGLWGFEGQLPANPVVDRIVYEYLYTKDQTTSVYWDKNHDIPEQVSGRDNYYNHYIYAGWQHWGMGIGNP